jgi:hypothetical protein
MYRVREPGDGKGRWDRDDFEMPRGLNRWWWWRRESLAIKCLRRSKHAPPLPTRSEINILYHKTMYIKKKHVHANPHNFCRMPVPKDKD